MLWVSNANHSIQRNLFCSVKTEQIWHYKKSYYRHVFKLVVCLVKQPLKIVLLFLLLRKTAFLWNVNVNVKIVILWEAQIVFFSEIIITINHFWNARQMFCICKLQVTQCPNCIHLTTAKPYQKPMNIFIFETRCNDYIQDLNIHWFVTDK